MRPLDPLENGRTLWEGCCLGERELAEDAAERVLNVVGSV
jgi:hypothetical protein